MFCSDIFLRVIQDNFVNPTSNNIVYFRPTHSTNKEDIYNSDLFSFESEAGPFFCAYEEPLDDNILNIFQDVISESEIFSNYTTQPSGIYSKSKFLINSEFSQFKNAWLKKNRWIDWYCFYHGFASLYWFSRFQFLPKTNDINFTHIFINLNNLISKKRSYRMNFLAQVVAKKLDRFGLISMPRLSKNVIKEEISDPASCLSQNAKKLIYTNLSSCNKKFILDTFLPDGILSADINEDLQKNALFEIVSETVFYDQKLHLTEKIFKPIAMRKPFILLSAPGNLQYLKGYGFKTFNNWIDESYDLEPDNDVRISKVVGIIERLSQCSREHLETMYHEMQEVVEYNFNHFYGDFKKIIINELFDNFEKAMKIYNYDKFERFQLTYKGDIKRIKDFFLL